METAVVVIRMNNGEDVLAILSAEFDGILRIEHPHFVKLNESTGTVSIVPYCGLSDERFYEIKTADTQFVVLASNEVTSKFFHIVNAAEAKQTRSMLDYLEPLDQLEAMIDNKTYIDGNDTKH